MSTPKRTISRSAYEVLERSEKAAALMENAWITPEHVLCSMEAAGAFRNSAGEPGKNPTFFRDRLAYFLSCLPREEDKVEKQKVSALLQDALSIAIETAGELNAESVDIPHLIFGISLLEDSLAGYLLRKNQDALPSF